MSANNPLLEFRFPIPFERIQADHVRPAADFLIGQAKHAIECIAAQQDGLSFGNTLQALDCSTTGLDFAIGIVRHLESVATTPELRAAYNEVQPAVSEFYSSIPLHEGLWRVLSRYRLSGEALGLNGVRKRYLEKTIDTFRRHGAELDEAGKAALREIDVELSKAATRFGENVLDATAAFELLLTEESKLSGLPPSAVDAARQSARSKGLDGWRFTLHAPSLTAVLTYLDDPSIREKMYLASNSRSYRDKFDNTELVLRILELRRRKAVLLGYGSFADFALEDRMAKSGSRAWDFLKELHEKTIRAFERDFAELIEFRRRLEGPDAPELAPWDVAYYAEKLRQERFRFSEEELRPYFPLESVLAGMFDAVGRLYGIRIEEVPGVPAWYADVKYYRILDSSGEELAGFYTDWFPRDSKRGGAWMDALYIGLPSSTGWEPHIGLMCGNLTPPVNGKPSLLTHREVETIWHEFGHLLHHALSRVEIRSLSGTNVAWDFVELPSQIMENWCWERSALDLFARHYLTGETIPEDLFRKMLAARTFRAATAQMRQLGFGYLDFALHMEYSPDRDGDVVAYSRRILDEFSPARLPETHAMVNSFLHLFSSPVGYGAGYYSYKWAEVLDADAFSRFRREGIFNPQTGREFRDKILSRGDSEDPAVLYREFMGRDPDVTALLERAGLL